MKIQSPVSHETTPPASSENRNNTQTSTDKPNSINDPLIEMRSRISDLGFEIDAEKAGAAMAMGAGVFLILLAALACYDLVRGNAGLWLTVGITRDMLDWIAYGCGAGGAALMVLAIWRRTRPNRSREAELARLEQECAGLIERKDSLSQN